MFLEIVHETIIYGFFGGILFSLFRSLPAIITEISRWHLEILKVRRAPPTSSSQETRSSEVVALSWSPDGLVLHRPGSAPLLIRAGDTLPTPSDPPETELIAPSKEAAENELPQRMEEEIAKNGGTPGKDTLAIWAASLNKKRVK